LLLVLQRPKAAIFATIVVSLLTIGCGSATSPTPGNRIVSFQVTGPASIRLNETGQFTAVITYADGRKADVTRTALWSSEPELLTFLPNTGTATATAVAQGGASVRATLPPGLSQLGFKHSPTIDVLVLEPDTLLVSGLLIRLVPIPGFDGMRLTTVAP
jgi:hypothetical protein